jgi:hypothetical protein
MFGKEAKMKTNLQILKNISIFINSPCYVCLFAFRADGLACPFMSRSAALTSPYYCVCAMEDSRHERSTH